MSDLFGSPSESVKTIPNIAVSKPEEFQLRAVGMVFANCSVIEMIDHSKGLRNVKKHIYRQKASSAFCSDDNDIRRQRRCDVISADVQYN